MPRQITSAGRPVKYAMPGPIPDTPENIMRALLSAPPRREERLGLYQAIRTGNQAPVVDCNEMLNGCLG